MGNELLNIILSLSFSGTLLGFIILAIKPAISRFVSKKWQYYIWIFVVLRMLVPFTAEINFVNHLFEHTYHIIPSKETMLAEEQIDSDFNSSTMESNGTDIAISNIESFSTINGLPSDDLNDSITNQTNNINETVPDSNAKNSDNSKAHTSFTLSSFLSYAWVFWIFGAILFFVIKLVDYNNFIRYIKINNKPITDESILAIMDDVSMDYHIKKTIPLYHNPLIISPMLAGAFHPFIVIPDNSNISREHLYYVFSHELTHYKRKDIWYKWLIQLTLCIHWFNPFLYLMNREVNRACELSCDEFVMKHCNESERKAYGNMLLDVADLMITYRNNVLSTTLIENKNYMKERLKQIMTYKKLPKTAILASALSVCLIAATGVAIGAKKLPLTNSSELASTSNSNHESKATSMNQLNTIPENLMNSFLSSINNSFSSYDYSNNMLDSSTIADLYENDEWIAKNDISRNTVFNSYSKSDRYCKAKKLKLNGSHTLSVVYITKDTTINMKYKATLQSGKYKIVLIQPDKKVSILAEGTGNTTISIPLKKGRNCIKMVGKDCSVKNLEIKFDKVESSALEKWFSSAQQERAALFLQDLRNKKPVDTSELTEIAVFMNSKELSECFSLFLKQNIMLPEDQLEELLPFLDSETIKTYLEQYTKTNSFSEDFIDSLAPFVDSNTLFSILQATIDNPKINQIELLCDLAPFLNSNDISSYLTKLLKKGIKPSIDDLSDLAPFMDSNSLNSCLKEIIKTNPSISINDLADLAPFLDSSSIASSLNELTKKNSSVTVQDLIDLAPFLDSSSIASCLKNLLENGSSVDVDDLNDLAPFLDSKTIYSSFTTLIKNGVSIDMDDFVDLVPFLDSTSIHSCFTTLIKNGASISIDDLIHLAPFMSSKMIASSLDYLIKNNVDMDMDDLINLAPFMDSDTIASSLDYLVKNNVDMDADDLIDLAPFMNSYNISDFLKNLL